ncbi:hypothetical protein CMP1-26 [Clavibacter phage CMP1]|uniref:Uncharacterized protein n=1 Tax=Clavibacter phage CMP1 TaxID=686439 RepID=D0U210_9CAUD|nr:hypothetical protein CMP1-26 [Clavibacter phage CMP1]ACY35922.1 hypothetical protein CMP1-26 [Clavibacter phage CMP1]
MTDAMKHYRHSVSGVVSEMTEAQAAAFPDYLEEVPEGTKSYVQGMFKPGKVGEHENPEPETEAQPTGQKATTGKKTA